MHSSYQDQGDLVARTFLVTDSMLEVGIKQRRHRLLAMASITMISTHAIQPPKAAGFSEISGTSAATRGLVSSLTAAVNALGGKATQPTVRQREVASLTSEAVLAGLRRDFVENEYLWSGKITPELYDEECVFTDPTLSFSGLSTFEANLENLDPWINRFVPSADRRVELSSLRLVAPAGMGDDATPAIEAEWRMVGDISLPWRPRHRM